VDPANTQVIVAGGYALFRTNDEGANWTESSPIHPDQRACLFSPGGQVVYVGNDGGIVKSKDNGNTWTNLNHNFPGALLYSAAFSQGSQGTRMIAGTQDAGVVFSGLSSSLDAWYMIFGGDSGYDLIDPNDSTNAYWVIYD